MNEESIDQYILFRAWNSDQQCFFPRYILDRSYHLKEKKKFSKNNDLRSHQA